MGKKLVFTGGHHTSALEVAKALKEKGWEIVWFGHRHSMWGDTKDSAEYQEVTAAGIKFYDLKAGKFYRTFHPLKLIRIPWGFIQAKYWLFKERPQGIVSFGGYLAVPTVIMGWILGIKSVTHEQTVVTGWANKILAPFVEKIAVTWPNSLQYYSPGTAVLVGLPVRKELLTQSKAVRLAQPILYITGGKQGSQAINNVVFDSIEELTKKYHVIHQTGNYEAVTHTNYESFTFDSKKAIEALQQAEIVVSRSGAHTVYELGVLGKKSVLIPLPNVSHHEQDVNAQVLVDAGSAIVLSQNNLTSQNLLAALEKAENLNPVKLNLPLDATTKMVKLVEEVMG